MPETANALEGDKKTIVIVLPVRDAPFFILDVFVDNGQLLVLSTILCVLGGTHPSAM